MNYLDEFTDLLCIRFLSEFNSANKTSKYFVSDILWQLSFLKDQFNDEQEILTLTYMIIWIFT